LLPFQSHHAMEFSSPDVHSKERVTGAEVSGNGENAASVGPAAAFESVSTSSAENLPVLSDSKVRLICHFTDIIAWII